MQIWYNIVRQENKKQQIHERKSMETEKIVFAVCDDVKEIRDNIERNIRMLYENTVILHFENGKALTEYKGRIDILFLDIQMEGISGMEAAKILRRRGSRAVLIFVTAIEEAVYEAFDVGAFHYLVKPVDRVKFFEVLRKAVAEYDFISRKKREEEPCLVIKTGSVTRKIRLSEILYLEVFNRKIMIHTLEEDMEFYGKLVSLEDRLSDDFMRCHRAYIVHLRYVAKYDANSITMEDGRTVLLSKQKYAEFVRRYMMWLRKQQTCG